MTTEAVTPAEIRTLITASNLEVDFGAELLDADDVLIEDISADLLDGGIEHQNYADVHGTCTLQLSRTLDWATARVRPYQTLTGAGLTRSWPLGVYLPIRPETSLGETPITYDMSLHDKLQLLMKAVGDTYVVASGTGYLAAVRTAITDSGYTGLAPLLDGTSEATVLDAPMVWVLDANDLASWLRVVNDLLAAVGYRGLYADRNGRYCSEPYQDPRVRPSIWTLDLSDPRTNIVAEYRKLTTDTFDATNWWTFWREGMTAQPTEGSGRYTVDLSDGGTKVKSPQPLDVANQTALEARGDEIVQTARQVGRTLVIDTSPLPILEHFCCLQYRDPASIGEFKTQTRSWILPLNGDDMTLTLEVLD